MYQEGKNQVPEELMVILKRQKYKVIGEHSAVKKCHWLHESLLGNEACYKNKFYGISSWRCLQMTPSISYCTMQCLFCWRVQSSDLNLNFDETVLPSFNDPKEIVDGCIEAQMQILSGYKANKKLDKERYNEALSPRHAAISLAGEPTIYPYLGDLIEEFKNRNFTTFLVTNGTIPKNLMEIGVEPTQLYVSLCAPDEWTFKKTCRPQIPNAWKNLNVTLEMLKSFNCPTVIRMSLVRDLNLIDPESYAKLIEKANPTYIETKAYMYVGMSRKRLDFKNMPIHEDIRNFADSLAKITGYYIIDESPKSRVILLSRLKKAIRFDRH